MPVNFNSQNCIIMTYDGLVKMNNRIYHLYMYHGILYTHGGTYILYSSSISGFGGCAKLKTIWAFYSSRNYMLYKNSIGTEIDITYVMYMLQWWPMVTVSLQYTRGNLTMSYPQHLSTSATSYPTGDEQVVKLARSHICRFLRCCLFTVEWWACSR